MASGIEAMAQGALRFGRAGRRSMALSEELQAGLVEFREHAGEVIHVLAAQEHDLEHLAHLAAVQDGLEQGQEGLLDAVQRVGDDPPRGSGCGLLSSRGREICSRMAKNSSALLAKCQYTAPRVTPAALATLFQGGAARRRAFVEHLAGGVEDLLAGELRVGPGLTRHGPCPGKLENSGGNNPRPNHHRISPDCNQDAFGTDSWTPLPSHIRLARIILHTCLFVYTVRENSSPRRYRHACAANPVSERCAGARRASPVLLPAAFWRSARWPWRAVRTPSRARPDRVARAPRAGRCRPCR
jgi:hypothetical protein